MQPGINNDNFSEESRNSQESNNANNDTDSNRITSKNTDDKYADSEKQNQDHEMNVNDVQDNDTVKNSWDAESKTFNEDDDSWDDKKDDDATTSNEGTKNNNWDANDQMQRTPGYNDEEETRDAAAGDYIDSNHENYNWNDDRFRWSED
jgi:hypothetical protein